ncbi:MAG: hypothetical protein ACREQP_18765 [Candidatus Binatia bacterium]
MPTAWQAAETFRSPFNLLRVNEGRTKNIEDFPFVPSLSKDRSDFQAAPL